MEHSDRKTRLSNLAGVREGGQSPAARRALAETEARHRLAGTGAAMARNEINGRGGLDPARYGDWEVKGIVSDF
jgi:hypothetical protein